MSNLIDKEVTFQGTPFILKQIAEIREGLFLGYLEGKEYNTTLNLGVLRIGNDFVDELYKKELVNEPK